MKITIDTTGAELGLATFTLRRKADEFDMLVRTENEKERKFGSGVADKFEDLPAPRQMRDTWATRAKQLRDFADKLQNSEKTDQGETHGT